MQIGHQKCKYKTKKNTFFLTLGFTEKLHHIMLYQADLNRQESN